MIELLWADSNKGIKHEVLVEANISLLIKTTETKALQYNGLNYYSHQWVAIEKVHILCVCQNIPFYPRTLREERGSSDGHFLLLFSSLFPHLQLFVPTRPKKAQVLFLPGRKKLKFCSYPAEKSSSFVPTRPKKAQVFFLPGWKKLKFCSYQAEKSSSFVPTRPKKAQVLFLPGRKNLKFCSYPAEKSLSFVPTQPRKAQVFVSLRYRKCREVGWRVGPSLSMRSCFLSEKVATFSLEYIGNCVIYR